MAAARLAIGAALTGQRRHRHASLGIGALPAASLLAASLLLYGCGSTQPRPAAGAIPRWLLLEARTIGRGERFHPPASGPAVGRCRPALGARLEAHVELFAANQVVLVAAGIGTTAPRSFASDRIVGARCYGALVTLDPTGVVLVRPGRRLTLSDLFRSWGQPLSDSQLASFAAAPGAHVMVFVDGRRLHRAPGNVPLTGHAEIVLEVGPYVPPHRFYTFPPLP
ncbi:MAG: hypothetical protein ACLP8S_31440 [Solirubrobacteraceae bacterium]